MAGKVAVFGILKRQGKVLTVVVENAKNETLLPVIKRKIKPDSWVYTDTYRSYDALDVSEFHRERINHVGVKFRANLFSPYNFNDTITYTYLLRLLKLELF